MLFRSQLQKMQDAVIDLEDLSSGVSIADLTLNDFRIDLAGHLRDHRDQLETLPLGTYAVVSGLEPTASDNDLPPGVIFCLRAVGDAAAHAAEPRSEEHTSELQSLMRISYAVFCLK